MLEKNLRQEEGHLGSAPRLVLMVQIQQRYDGVIWVVCVVPAEVLWVWL